MARGRQLNTLADFKKSLKAGYGLGTGSSYKPWLRVQDVPSRGQSAKITGLKTQRIHHTLSSNETQLFYLAEFSDRVVDIREQFPLIPLSLSLKIAKEIGVEHPRVPSTGHPNVITTDFLITCSDNGKESFVAFNVKPEDEVNKLRILEKIDIENQWWNLQGVDFKEFIPSEITKIQSSNISWFTDPVRHKVDNIQGLSEELKLVASQMVTLGQHKQEDLCNRFISEFQLDPITSVNLLKVIIGEKKIIVDLSLPIPTTGLITVKSIPSVHEVVANENRS
jgi:hypothetical protein